MDVTAGYRDRKATVTVSYRTLLWILTGMAVLGVVLAVIGLRAAFAQLPPREDHIIVVAIIVAFAAVVGACSAAFVMTRRR